MKRKYLLYGFLLLIVIFIWRTCTYKTKEKYILPNGYKGFFGVIYQANPNLEKLKDGNYRLYKISPQGVYESGYRFAKGTLHQEFYYQNGEKISSFGFQMLSYLKNEEIYELRTNQTKTFGILVKGDFINGGENSVDIYFVGTGAEILKLLSKSEKLFFSLGDYDRHLEEEKNSLIYYIQRLNQEYKAKMPPFD